MDDTSGDWDEVKGISISEVTSVLLAILKTPFLR